MKLKYVLIIVVSSLFLSHNSINNEISKTGRFNVEKDLLLVQFDCKTDVDDLHTIAAFITLMTNTKFSNVKYHAVAGTYGIQEGLYVPANNLFQLAFEDNWTDAHENFESASEKVKNMAIATLVNKGDIWIAEAGQSDFSATVIRSIQKEIPQINVSERIHIVQHSSWNEDVTSPDNLQFVKTTVDYHKISDGNAVGNGTPGFRSPEFNNWKSKVKDPRLLEIWNLATGLGNKYNGVDGRYNNGAITKGGLDFSDLSEVCWIFEIEDIVDTTEFFDLYVY